MIACCCNTNNNAHLQIFTTKFDHYVTAGDKVPYQLKIKKLYEPLYMDQDVLRVAFFSSPHKDSQYTDDPDVVKEGEVVVNIPDKGAKRQIGSSCFGDLWRLGRC